jgi:hypothetical protein
VALGNGDGTFKPAINYELPAPAYCIVQGDFNLDGRTDLVTRSRGGLFILLNGGDGTFLTYANCGPDLGPGSATVGDFDGDGRLDLAINVRDGVAIHYGRGDGSFLPAISFAAGASPSSVAVGDFDGDGRDDLVVANAITLGSVSVLLNRCAPVGVDLDITRSGSGLAVSWPFPANGFALESATDFGLTNWVRAAELPTIVNRRWQISTPADRLLRYFRLREFP